MRPLLDDGDFQLYQGDAREVLPQLNAEVDCCITSPPYFRLRDYDTGKQIGLEDSIDEYLVALCQVFDAVGQLLTPAGSLWVVIDDSYAGGGNYRGIHSEFTLTEKQRSNGGARGVSQKLGGIKELPAKNLCLIPHRFALDMQARGWYVRQEVIWHKPNTMVESAKDRCTRAHEYIFHFTRQPHYWWNHVAMQEPANWDRWGRQTPLKDYWPTGTEGRETRNTRSVWTVPTANYPEAHYAVFPDKLVANMLNATCPPLGIVLDPFMGSGTVARVARVMRRRAIGVELSPDYCEQIVRNTSQLAFDA